MTKTCCVCRKISVTGDSSRSFHKFPVNEDIKKQWMDALGISKVTVSCTVCSDHFSPDSYPDQTDGVGMVKRLLRTAIPFRKGVTVKKNLKATNSNDSEYGKGSKRDKQSTRRTRLSNGNCKPKVYYNYDEQSNDSSLHSTDEKMDMDYMNSKSKRRMWQMWFSDTLIKDATFSFLTDSNASVVNHKKNSNLPSTNIRRMFRFRDGNETKYLCREEFVTEEAWNKFLRLMVLNRQKLESRHQSLSIKQKEFEYQYQYEEIKDEDAYEPEKFLEVILKE